MSDFSYLHIYKSFINFATIITNQIAIKYPTKFQFLIFGIF